MSLALQTSSRWVARASQDCHFLCLLGGTLAHQRLLCPCACRPLCQAAARPAARSSARRAPLAARASSREAELAKMQEFKAGLSQTLDSAAKRPTATGEGRLCGC